MAYLEVRNAPITPETLLEIASRHYWTQLVQQFYVLVLGLNILGNPYSAIGDFSRGFRAYYEPHLGSMSPSKTEDISYRLGAGIARLLGQCAGARGTDSTNDKDLFWDVTQLTPVVRKGVQGVKSNDVPDSVIEADRLNPSSVALALTGLIARPTFDVCRSAARAAMSRQPGDAGGALRACEERSGGRLVARRRLPRHCPPAQGVSPYCGHSALGLQLLWSVGRGHYADTDKYIAHAHLASNNSAAILLTTQHILMVRSGGGVTGGSWHAEWCVRLDDLVAVPKVVDDKLVLIIKQDEVVNYFATDEKLIEIPDPEVRAWFQSKIETAMLLALEDKRVATE